MEGRSGGLQWRPLPDVLVTFSSRRNNYTAPKGWLTEAILVHTRSRPSVISRHIGVTSSGVQLNELICYGVGLCVLEMSVFLHSPLQKHNTTGTPRWLLYDSWVLVVLMTQSLLHRKGICSIHGIWLLEGFLQHQAVVYHFPVCSPAKKVKKTLWAMRCKHQDV